MDRLIYTAMTGASSTLGQQAAVAHNMANATSTGFKTELHRLRAVPVQNAQMPTRAFVADASVASLSSRYASFNSSKRARGSQAASRGRESKGAEEEPGGAAAGNASGRPDDASANRRSSVTGSESPGVAGPVDCRS